MVEIKRRFSPHEHSSRGEFVTTKPSSPDRHNAGPIGLRTPQTKCDDPATEATNAAPGTDLDPAAGIIVAVAISLAVWGGSLILYWFVT